MPLEVYLETVGIILLCIGSAVLGKVYAVDYLTTIMAPGLFGVALGFLGGSARSQQRLEALRKADKLPPWSSEL